MIALLEGEFLGYAYTLRWKRSPSPPTGGFCIYASILQQYFASAIACSRALKDPWEQFPLLIQSAHLDPPIL